MSNKASLEEEFEVFIGFCGECDEEFGIESRGFPTFCPMCASPKILSELDETPSTPLEFRDNNNKTNNDQKNDRKPEPSSTEEVSPEMDIFS